MSDGSSPARRTTVGDAELAALRDFIAAMHRWRSRFASHHGLTINDTMVLTALVADTAGRVTAAALARAVDVASGRLTGSLDRLEAAGLARRAPNPHDRRSVIVTLTDAGRAATDVLDRSLRTVVADAPDIEFRERFTARLYTLSGAADQSRI